MLLWYNGVIFQQNSACGIWAWAASNETWNQTNFPSGINEPAAVGYTCPGIGGIWTANVAGEGSIQPMLLTSPSAINSSWSGPISLFYETFIAACVNPTYGDIGDREFTGTLSITNSVVGESPLYVAGTQNLANDDCAGPAHSSPPGTFTGSLVPGSTLTLNSIDTGGYKTSINWNFNGNLYYQPSSLASVAGTWYDNTDVETLTISPTGVMTESNLQTQYAGCTVGGQISIINQFYNLYSFSLTWSGCPGGPYEHGFSIAGFLTIDASKSPRQLLGGGSYNNGSGGAANMTFSAAGE